MVALHLAIKNVFRKRERSFLTIIGVLLAVGSFIALFSIAEGLDNRINREINWRNVDIYVLPQDGTALPTGPIGTIGASIELIPVDTVKKMAKVGDVATVCPISRIYRKIGDKTVVIFGISQENFKLFFPKLELVSGSCIFDDGKPEVILGGGLTRKEGTYFQEKGYKVVGTGVKNGSFQDYICFMSVNQLMRLKKEDRGYNEIWIKLKDDSTAKRQDVALALCEEFPGLKIKTREEYLSAAGEYVAYAKLLQIAIASIGILISMTASMNTMLMSAYERIKEFGTLRSIGASRFVVIEMILAESMILTLIGGLCGILLGVMGSWVLDEMLRVILQISFPLAKITPMLIVYGVSLSVLIGAIGAIIPAYIVNRIKIIEALRWE